MKRTMSIIASMLLVGAVCGCGGSGTSPTSNANGAAQKDAANVAAQATEPSVVVAAASPKEAVTSFLNALRDGQEKQAEALLSAQAREETTKHNMAVEPPGAPNATYHVGDVEHHADRPDAALVSCVWSEKFPNGLEETYEVVWSLRKETAGWRIAGMFTQFADSEAPVFLNFEDLEDMENKVREAETAAAQRSASQATGALPSDASRR
jgi:hypothetical protein